MIFRFSNTIRNIGIFLGLAGLLGCSHHSDPELPGSDDTPLEIRMDVKLISGERGAQFGSKAGAPAISGMVAVPEENLEHLRVIIVEKADGSIVHNRGIVLYGGVSEYDDMRFEVKPSTAYDIYLLGNCLDLGGLGDDLDFGIDALPVGSVYPVGKIENARIDCLQGHPMIDNSGESVRKAIPITEKYSIVTDAYNGELHQVQDVSFVMVRAAVKFSFTVNVTDDFTGVKANNLKAINISGLGNSMYLLPRDAVFYDDDQESEEGIVSFTVPEGVVRGNYDFTLPGDGLDLTAGMEEYVWDPLIYFPEATTPVDGFLCTLTFKNLQTALVAVPLPELPYGLPRNTHVKVAITIGNYKSIQVKVSVMPWNQTVSEFDFSEDVGIATDGFLKFIDGTYTDLNKETGRLVLKNSGTAQGSFGIASPKGAHWTAYLITESGLTDAIQFVLPDGTTSTRISGIVDDTIDDFEIKSVFPAGVQPNTAILQVVVTTDDGRGIPINILTGAGYGADVRNLTIIQNPL